MRRIQSSILLLLISTLSVSSQENDFQTWHSLSFKKRGIHKIDMTFKSALRLRRILLYILNDSLMLNLKNGLTKEFLLQQVFVILPTGLMNIKQLSSRFYSDINYKKNLLKKIVLLYKK